MFKGFWEYPGGLMACALLYLFVLFRNEKFPFPGPPRFAAWVIMVGIGVLLAQVLGDRLQIETDAEAMSRNFYGVLRVERINAGIRGKEGYSLLHGRIRHGFQFIDEKVRNIPVSYYAYESGVGLAETTLRQMAEEAGQRPMK